LVNWGGSTSNFSDRLIDAIREKKNPSVVGLDPDMDKLPDFLKRMNRFDAVWEFNRRIIDAVCDVVPAVKPNMAFYQELDPDGLSVLGETIDYAKKKCLIVILDGKRNDIDNTAKQYARTHLGNPTVSGIRYPRVLDIDAVTVNPYLGSDGVMPFIDMAREYGKGVFVLAKTSNKSSAEIQDRLTPLTTEEFRRLRAKFSMNDASIIDDLPAMKLDSSKYPDGMVEARTKIQFIPNYVIVGDLIDSWGSGQGLIGDKGYSSVGAVVGATHPAEIKFLRKIMPKIQFLLPGYGAQGGTGDDCANGFNEDGEGAVVVSARGVTFAFTKDPYKSLYVPEKFDEAARAAAIAMKDDLRESLQRAGKWNY
jgi:orotidine-5'-phosphate decarboxylase